MRHRPRPHKFVSAVALLLAGTFFTACTAWHTTTLQPQRFSADSSPERVRLTLSDGTQLTARHPVMTGDSLVWANGSGRPPADSARSALLASSINKVEVHGVDNPRTIALTVFLFGLVVGVAVIGSAIGSAIGGGN